MNENDSHSWNVSGPTKPRMKSPLRNLIGRRMISISNVSPIVIPSEWSPRSVQSEPSPVTFLPHAALPERPITPPAAMNGTHHELRDKKEDGRGEWSMDETSATTAHSKDSPKMLERHSREGRRGSRGGKGRMNRSSSSGGLDVNPSSSKPAHPTVFVFLRGRRVETSLHCTDDAIFFGVENLKITAENFDSFRRIPLEEQQSIRLPAEPPSPTELSTGLRPRGEAAAVAGVLARAHEALQPPSPLFLAPPPSLSPCPRTPPSPGRRRSSMEISSDIMLETWEISWKDEVLEGVVRRVRFESSFMGYDMVSNKIDEWEAADKIKKSRNIEPEFPVVNSSFSLFENLGIKDPLFGEKQNMGPGFGGGAGGGLLRNSSLPAFFATQKWTLFPKKEPKRGHKGSVKVKSPKEPASIWDWESWLPK